MKRARSAAADDSVLSALRSAASVHVARQGEVVVLSEGGSHIVSLESDDAIRETLAAAAEDDECRMTIALEAINSKLEEASTPAIDGLVGICIEEATACGLSRRHGVRLALEAVLSHDRTPAKAKEIAAAVHDAALGPRPVTTILALLQLLDAGDTSLNVLSVLCFGEALAASDRATLTAMEEAPLPHRTRLKPLMEWLQRSVEPPPADTSDDVGDHGDDDEETDATTATTTHNALWHRVAVHGECEWAASAAKPALVAELGTSRDGVVVLDGLVDDRLRAELFSLIVGCDAKRSAPPAGRWERTTIDGEGLPRTWGLQPRLLRQLERQPPPCIVEVQTRLAALYPEYEIARIDATAVAPSHSTQADAEHCCTSFVANAAVYGNAFCWHVDADPASLPPSRWLATHGDYANGERGKPLLVSLLVYLDEHWQRDWDAETLFLEDSKGVGFLVQPRPARAVLMHQDVTHRVSTPSLSARRPRYSLVWKLAFVPREKGGVSRERETICRPEWGTPVRVM